MLAASRLSEEGHGSTMWFPGKKMLWATAPASAVASTRTEQLARAREEMLGLLADLPESEHELSFSDLVVVDADPDKGAGDVFDLDLEVANAAGSEGRPAHDHDQKGLQEGAGSAKEVKDSDVLGASKRRRKIRSGVGSTGSEQPVLPKPNRSGSGRGLSGEGVLLNLYMPSSLTRSLTTGSSSNSRRCSSARERPAAAACTAPGRKEAQMARLGCWSSMWSTKGKQHNNRGSSSSITEEKGKDDGHNNKKNKVQSARRASSEALV